MSESQQRVPESQIATLVGRSLASLQTLIPAVDSSSKHTSAATSYLARLKIWAGSLGAHRHSGNRSLDYRLRDASNIRNHIQSLLQDLCEAVDGATANAKADAVPSSIQRENLYSIEDELGEYFLESEESEESEESDMDQLLAEVGHIVDCLLRLSVTLSNPAPHDDFKSTAGAEIDDFWDIQHVREKFPHADPGIIQRLGMAMTRRRQYFKYREEHHNKISQGLGSHDEIEVAQGGEKTTVASSIPRHLKDPIDNTMPELDVSQGSKTSYVLSNANQDQLRVPPLPMEFRDGPFMCPFCFLIVSIDTGYAWKKHVFRDLRPYVCLATSCPSPGQLYLRRSEWIRHMENEHWIVWICQFGCPGRFHSSSEFREHIEKTHLQDVSHDRMHILERLCGQPDQDKALGQCPLCDDLQAGLDQYTSHVGGHLQTLALFSLPNTQGENEEDKSDKADDQEDIAENLDNVNRDNEDNEDNEDNDDSNDSNDNDDIVSESDRSRQTLKRLEKSLWIQSSDAEITHKAAGKVASHLPSTSGSGERLQCPHCNRSFKNYMQFDKHIRMHPQEKKFECPECDTGFSLQKHLRRHMEVHHNQGDDDINKTHCDVCGKQFSRLDNLQRHLKKVHDYKGAKSSAN